MAKEEGASLRPSEAIEGGLLDDATVEWLECRFVMWDYQGKIAEETPALKVTLQPDDGGDPVEQYYSMGSAKDWAPASNGKSLIPIGTATALRKSSNGYLLLESLVNCGFPEDDIGDDISIFEGLVAHMARVPQPKRRGLAQPELEEGRERTVLVVDEIITMPGEKKKGKGAPKGAGKAKKAPAKAKKEETEPAEDMTEKATEAVLTVIGEADEPIPRTKLPTVIFKHFKGDMDRSELNEIAKIVFDEEFLSDGPWEYDAKEGTVS